MNMCEQAEAFRLLLIMGVASKPEIIAWADDLIAKHDNLPGWLLDVSLAANQDEDAIELKLRGLPCEGNRMIAAYSAIDRFAQVFRTGGIPTRMAAQMLGRWAASARVNQDEWSEAM